MSKFLISSIVAAMVGVSTFLIFSGILFEQPIKNERVTAYRTAVKLKENKVPPIQNELQMELSKISTVKDTLILEAKNTVVFRGPVTTSSVSKAIKELRNISSNLNDSDIIYLVLDTPGGSVFDGLELIDFLEGLPQEVRTVTLFAASMGFQIVQSNPGKRLIARNGILMSHRCRGNVEGQFDGELESQYKMIKRKIDYLDLTAANRVKMTYSDYKSKVINEWWSHGFDALSENTADEMVVVQCGKTLIGTTEETLNTMFGNITITFDNCPLIKEPLSVVMGQVKPQDLANANQLVREAYTDKIKFVKDIILTDEFEKLFKQ